MLIEWRLLLLILIANGAPIIARTLCGSCCAGPLDGGLMLADGRRLFGDSKTWRGAAIALLAASLGAVALGLPIMTGLVIGSAAMLGDLTSSFVKRRLGMASSSMVPGLDQIPESLLPLLAVTGDFSLNGLDIALGVAGFIALELTLSRLLYWLGIRNRPY